MPARIDILNRTPISMSVNDAIIEDNRRIEAIGGGLVVFTPGNVYVNGVDLSGNEDDSAQDITILQDALLESEYDFGGLVLPDVPQDLYIAGNVINENGNVAIANREGSINVSGIIRGEQVDIDSAKNFSLNTEGWFHTNQDPRQYIDYTLTRNTVFQSGKVRGRAQLLLHRQMVDGKITSFRAPPSSTAIGGAAPSCDALKSTGERDPARREPHLSQAGSPSPRSSQHQRPDPERYRRCLVDIAVSFAPPSRPLACRRVQRPGRDYWRRIPHRRLPGRQPAHVIERSRQGGDHPQTSALATAPRVATVHDVRSITSRASTFIERIDVTTDKRQDPDHRHQHRCRQRGRSVRAHGIHLQRREGA
jgi:hypothetical protein